MIPLSQLAPIGHPLLDQFLLGFVCACALVAAVFFLRFWRQTRDPLFLAFTVFLGIDGFNTAYVATLPHPNVGSYVVTLIRLVAALGVIFAIVWKNLA